MTISANIPVPDERFSRNIWVLIAAQAILGAQMPMIFVVAGLAGQSLASNACWATLSISIMVIGSMLSATPLSSIMQKYGRRVGFWIGTAAGMIGATIGAYGLSVASFPIFLTGAFFSGTYMSAQGFYRFAAAESVSDALRPKAISYVMAGGLFAALLGPQLAKVTVQAMAVPFLGTFVAIIALNAIGSLLFVFLKIPTPPVPKIGEARGRTRWEMIRTPRIAVAVICATVSYALMNLVMTSSPLAVVGCGFQTGNAADVVSAHVLAMYVPAFFTGHLITRFGSEKIIALGLVILAGAGAVALTGVNLANFFVALILLGVGWNFSFIGATSMLTAAHTPQERGRMQGLNDLLVYGGVVIASLSSGRLMNCSGSSAQDGWAAVNIAMLPFLVLAGGALIWLSMRPKEA